MNHAYCHIHTNKQTQPIGIIFAFRDTLDVYSKKWIPPPQKNHHTKKTRLSKP